MAADATPPNLKLARVMHCAGCGNVLATDPPAVCPSCGREHWDNPKSCASALVTHNGRLLLVRRAHDPWLNAWDIPGGFCGQREHPEQTAVREIKEETGFDVALVGLAGIWLDDYPVPYRATPECTLNIYYFAQLVDPEQIADPDPLEVVEIRWAPPDDVPRPLAFPAHLEHAVEAWTKRVASR